MTRTQTPTVRIGGILPVRQSDPRVAGKIRIFNDQGQWHDIVQPEPDTKLVEVRTITPQLAKFILEHYHKPNRNLRPPNVKKYTTAMQDNFWQLANPIYFDADGFLRDGQHRMHACMKSGKTIQFLCQFGTTEEELLTIDEGAARTTRDVAALRGQEIRSSVLSALSYLLEFAEIKRITPREYQSIFQDRHIEAANWVCDRLKKAPYNSNVIVALLTRAYYSCKHSQEQLDRLEKFINIFQGTGFGEDDYDTAAMAFKENFLSLRRQRSTGPNRKKIMRNGAWALDRFLEGVITKNILTGDPVELFPLPEETENDGKIVI